MLYKWINILKLRLLHENIPIRFALLGFWHRVICGYASRAVIPYAQRLAHFPAYLQQLDMESNGKRISLDGKPLNFQVVQLFGEIQGQMVNMLFQFCIKEQISFL